MPKVQVVPVTNRRQQKEFVRFPWRLYANDPNWIPPLIQNQRELLGYRRHPFWLDAECQTFLAYREGQVCGRISAIVNRAHNRRYDEQRGFFGFFESVNDHDVAHALFDEATTWLKQKGMTAVRGPMNPSFNYEMGLLVEGFERPPTFMMTYNPPYYRQLVDGYGFQQVQDLFSYGVYLEMKDDVDDVMWMVAREAPKRLGLTLRPFDKRKFRDEIKQFLNIYNEANGTHWGFVPLSEPEVEHMSNSLRHLIVPELTRIAEIDGKAIGTVFGLLDYNPVVKEIDGRLFPFGFIKLLTCQKRLTRLRLVATHVLPAYQKWGVGLVLMDGLRGVSLERGISEGEFSWVAESNKLSRQTLERGGALKENTWRLYDLEF